MQSISFCLLDCPQQQSDRPDVPGVATWNVDVFLQVVKEMVSFPHPGAGVMGDSCAARYSGGRLWY